MDEGLYNTIGKAKAQTEKQSWLFKPFNWLINRGVSTQTKEDLTWEDEIGLNLLSQSTARARALLYAVFAVLVITIAWAYFAKIDEITRGSGKVIPSRKVQVVQSLDGGIVNEILVKEGDLVADGTPLIKIDETRAVSSLRENQSQSTALTAKQARLRALAEGKSFNVPTNIQQQEEVIYQQELALYNASRAELNSAVEIARDQMVQREKELEELRYKKDLAEKTFESANKELTASKPLLASGAVSEIDILKLEREATRAKGEIDQARAQISRVQVAIVEAKRKIGEAEQSFLSKVRTELNETTSKINSLGESSVALSDKVKQSILKSPANGKVSRLYFNTVGGVIQPGKEVLEIVPTDDALVLETKVDLKDIAFLRPDQPAVVKLTAYDYTIYGALDAKVESIAANSTVDEKGDAYYLVRVRTIKNSLGENLPIIPGMVAQVDILTGKKTVLSYLLKPVLKAKAYAMSER